MTAFTYKSPASARVAELLTGTPYDDATSRAISGEESVWAFDAITGAPRPATEEERAGIAAAYARHGVAQARAARERTGPLPRPTPHEVPP